MADLLNRANVDTAINTLLDDAQPNEAIQPSDHNGLLKNILDTLANGLSTTLRTNPETAGQDIEVTSGDKLKFKSSTFFNSLITETLTSDQTLTLPNKTGTIAILSDIENLFTDDLTLGANRSHNAVEYDWKITHNATDGSVNAVGIDTGKISHAGSRTATNSSYSTNWFWGQFLSTFTNTSTNANTNISQTNSALQLSNTDAVNDTTTINLSPTALNAQHVAQTTQSDLILQGPQAKLINSSGTGTVNTAVQLTNTDASLFYTQGNVTSSTEVNNSNISLSFSDIGGNANGSTAGGSLILSNSLGHEFTDLNENGSGLKYALDYSANYTSRSLVDKAFVLANAGGDSIYTADGTLSSNRTVNLNGKTLHFEQTTGKIELPSTSGGQLDFYNGSTISHKIMRGASSQLSFFYGQGFPGSAGFVFGSETKIASEDISLQGDTLIKGANTLSTSSALQIYNGDSTPNSLWDFRNNGDVVVGQNPSFIGNTSFLAHFKFCRITNATNNSSSFSLDLLDSANNQTTYARFGAKIISNTISSEYGEANVQVRKNGTITTLAEFDSVDGLSILSNTTSNLFKAGDVFTVSTSDATVKSSSGTPFQIQRLTNGVGNGVGFNIDLRNSSNAQATYGRFVSIIESNTDGSHTGRLELRVADSGTITAKVKVKTNTINVNIPTSSAGLVSGDLWNDGGTVKIV